MAEAKPYTDILGNHVYGGSSYTWTTMSTPASQEVERLTKELRDKKAAFDQERADNVKLRAELAKVYEENAKLKANPPYGYVATLEGKLREASRDYTNLSRRLDAAIAGESAMGEEADKWKKAWEALARIVIDGKDGDDE